MARYNYSDNAIRQHRKYGQRSRHGRSTVDIDCPFCGATTRAFVWSLAGGGKKCVGCGSIHASTGFTAPLLGSEDMAPGKENPTRG